MDAPFGALSAFVGPKDTLGLESGRQQLLCWCMLIRLVQNLLSAFRQLCFS